MQKLKAFLVANKVLIFAMLSAGALAVQQITSAYPNDYKIWALAGVVAAIGVLAKDLRGQWPTIIASLLPSLGAILTAMETNAPISWWQLIGSVAVAVGGVVAPPAKSLSYETSPVVTEAKKEAAAADASAIPPKTPPVETK